MNTPQVQDIIPVAPQITSLPSYLPIPGFGILPVNAFVIEAQQPVLVDTGLAALREGFLSQLKTVMDPKDLQWIWITHADPDHLGNLEAVLEEAPQAKIVTTYVGMGKMGMHDLPVERAYLLNPGQILDVGDRKLLATAPPCFDAPETVGLYDEKTATLFSADCFGALMEQPAINAAEMEKKALREGCIGWATVDAPWLQLTDRKRFKEELDSIARLNPKSILSAHLPPAKDMTDTLLGFLSEAQDAPRFVGPDQDALEKIMAA